jgi:hypothetical protein
MAPTIIFGSLAGVTSVLDAAPYIRDVIRRSTRPHRGTWLIWSILSILALSSQVADGAAWSVVMLAADALLTSLIFLLSIRRGVGGLSRCDLATLAIAGVGIAAWAVSATPVLATIFVVVADTLAVALMLPKTWRDPGSETLALYTLASVSGILSTLAVGALNPSLLLFPVYFTLANALIAAVIASRRSTLDTAALDRASAASDLTVQRG